MNYHINCYLNGRVKYSPGGAKRYHAVMRYLGLNRWSLQHFRTATEADEYGEELSQRYKRLALATAKEMA